MYSESKLGGGERCYWPRYHTLGEDGTLTLKVTGYEEDTSHWTGWITLTRSKPDYDFWHWMACTRRVSTMIPEYELNKWKKLYSANRNALSTSAA